MNRQGKLTDDSKFTTVMNAALEYHIEVSGHFDKDLISFYPHDGNRPCGFETCKIEEAPALLQSMIDEINQKGGEK